ncbi:L,D-transpeptidase family protein [Candidatus Dojkabacteria bacterium]|nr:L,D-transpeptidase family protein [Candidatus Dojkabacteria bacterium]
MCYYIYMGRIGVFFRRNRNIVIGVSVALFSVLSFFIVMPEFLRSNNSMEIDVTVKYGNLIDDNEIVAVAGDLEFSLKEIGVETEKLSGLRYSVLRVIPVSMEVYEVSFDQELFENFLSRANEQSYVEPENAEIVKDSEGLRIIDDKSGYKFTPKYTTEQIISQMMKGKEKIILHPIELNADVRGSDLKGNLDVMYVLSKEIYVLYDGMTVVIPSGEVLSFLDSGCSHSEKVCTVDLPCIDVKEVRSFVNGTLEKAWNNSESEYTTASNKAGSFKYKTKDYGPDNEDAVGGIVSVLKSRVGVISSEGCYFFKPETLNDEDTNDSNISGVSRNIADLNVEKTVRVGKKSVPGTDGSYAQKYIEIDHSQQHLYAWENGEVVMHYGVSGFYDNYAVFGVFGIKEKARNAWSDIAEKWMPYWMSYYYDPVQQAWFGIHELVWWDDENGVRHVESSENIGQKKSGGCIRLDRGPAEKVFNWAEMDMPVLIHP